jgi:hypothetical protein
MGIASDRRSFATIALDAERGAVGKVGMNRCARNAWVTSLWLLLATPALATSLPQDGDVVTGSKHPGCDGIDVKACVRQAIDAMGGEQRLLGIHSVTYDTMGHTVLSEQSYRQQPFITSYERDKVVVDFDQGRTARDVHLTWP